MVHKFKLIPPEGAYLPLDKDIRELLKDKLLALKVVEEHKENHKQISTLKKKVKVTKHKK